MDFNSCTAYIYTVLPKPDLWTGLSRCSSQPCRDCKPLLLFYIQMILEDLSITIISCQCYLLAKGDPLLPVNRKHICEGPSYQFLLDLHFATCFSSPLLKPPPFSPSQIHHTSNKSPEDGSCCFACITFSFLHLAQKAWIKPLPTKPTGLGEETFLRTSRACIYGLLHFENSSSSQAMTH